ncbi:MAG: uroporphyrinogen decarboxylase family protein [Kiritimatiellales bacterium]
MTPRQRIQAALSHEIPDRTPTDGWFHPEVREKLKAYFNLTEWDDVLLELGVEGWKVVDIPLADKKFDAAATPRPGGKPGPVAIWYDEFTYEDRWGVIQQKDADNRYEKRISGPLDDMDELEQLLQFPWPVLTEQVAPETLTNLSRQIDQLKTEQKFVVGGFANPFRTGWHLRGMDGFLGDYAAEPEMIDVIYDNLFAFYGDMARELAKAGVDMINVIGDLGMQTGMMINPDTWRNQDKPRWQKLLDGCRAINPALHFFFHSDGNIMAIVDDLIDVGFDVINPIQPECMDPRLVKQRWGNRITIHGGISMQQTLPFGSVEDVRREVTELIDHCGLDGGLVMFPSNVLQPDIPVENIVACFHAARDKKLLA